MSAVADTGIREASQTQAWRSLLTVLSGLPFFLGTYYFLDQALEQPDVATVTRVLPMQLLHGLMFFICASLTVLAIWFWINRHNPAPFYKTSLATTLLSVTALISTGAATGSYTSPTTLTAILALVIGLAWQPWRIVLWGFGYSLVGLIAYQTLVRAGALDYTPLLVPGTFVDYEPVAWWRNLRDLLVYGGLVEGLVVSFWVFGRLERQHRQLEEMARSDALTGLSSRSYFRERLEAEVERRNRYGHPFSLVLCNLDWFRLMNDTYGHVAGDDVLRKLGDLLGEVRRPVDVAARLGGDEFAFLLTDCDQENAVRVCDRLRQAMLSQEFTAGEKHFRVTMSMGVVECRGGDADSLLRAADAQLARAKELGRNRVVATVLEGEAA